MYQKDPKLSIIIPVYKAENYIEKCARSLFEQSLDDIEYIFIDDNSPDHSIEVLNSVIKDYPARQQSIKIIKMEKNSGQALVRKCGIFEAKGEFLAHCDSDDWVDKEMYKRLYEKAKTENLDMVWCDYYDSDGLVAIPVSQKCPTEQRSLIESCLAGNKTNISAYLWNRIYRRELHDKTFKYPSGDMTEDFAIVVQLIMRCSSIGYIEYPLYYHYANRFSITHSTSPQKVLKKHKDMILNTNLILSEISKYYNLSEFKYAIDSKKLSCKEILYPLLNNHLYRKLYRSTYSEINERIIFNPMIRWNSKLRSFCITYHLYWIYLILIKLHRRDIKMTH